MYEDKSSRHEETGSEFHIEEKSNIFNIIKNNDNNEYQQFEPSYCTCKDPPVSFQLNPYHQITEARVVLGNNNSNWRKSAEPPERCNDMKNGTSFSSQLEENDEDSLCPICFETIDSCFCKESLEEPKPIFVYQQRKQCGFAYKTLPMLTQCDCKRPVTVDLGCASRIPTSRNSKSSTRKFNRTVQNSCMNRCGYKSLVPDLSHFCFEETPFVHTITGSKLTEALKTKPCLVCGQHQEKCTCGEPIRRTAEKCKVCRKPTSCCTCPEPRRSRARCVCKEGSSKLDREDITVISSRPRSKKKLSIPSLKKSDSKKSEYRSDYERDEKKKKRDKKAISYEKNGDATELSSNVLERNGVIGTEETETNDETEKEKTPLNYDNLEEKNSSSEKYYDVFEEIPTNEIEDEDGEIGITDKPKAEEDERPIMNGDIINSQDFKGIAGSEEEEKNIDEEETTSKIFKDKSFLLINREMVKAEYRTRNRICNKRITIGIFDEEKFSMKVSDEDRRPYRRGCLKNSKIPRPVSRVARNCCENFTNTENRRFIDIGFQCQIEKTSGTCLCEKFEMGEMPCMKRGRQFYRSDGRVVFGKSTTSIQNSKRKGCIPMSNQRPNTASTIENKNNKEREAHGRNLKESLEEPAVKINPKSAEFLTMSIEQRCPREYPSFVQFSYGNIHPRDAKVNTDEKKMMNREQQCFETSRPSVRRQYVQSQTGGTFEQDMIASYVASCSCNPENLPPQQFMFQTLLYQFAGYELSNRPSQSRRRSSGRLRGRRDNAMRSIQVQAGSGCPPECEAAQTVTTFILNSPNGEAAERQINYVCGPDVPGLRTKVTMNLNQTAPVKEKSSCICAPTCGRMQEEAAASKSPENREEGASVKCRVEKRDKYVIIRVTPVQTDPCDSNNCILLAKSEDQPRTKKGFEQTTNFSNKDPKMGTVEKQEVAPVRNQIFSLETLKSRDFSNMLKKNIDDQKTSNDEASNGKNVETNIESTGVNRSIPTTSVACGSKSCIHQKKLAKIEDDPKPDHTLRPQVKQSEVVQCNLDTCSYVQRNDDDMYCISVQTERIYEVSTSTTTPNLIFLTTACDVCTNTEDLKVTYNLEYYDENEDSDMKIAICQTTSSIEDAEIKNMTTVIFEYCDAWCSPSGDETEEGASQEEISCSSSCDPEECNNGEQEESEGLKNEEVGEECRDSLCPNKVNTELDEQDVFKLELAMNRFIKVKPKSLDEPWI